MQTYTPTKEDPPTHEDLLFPSQFRTGRYTEASARFFFVYSLISLRLLVICGFELYSYNVFVSVVSLERHSLYIYIYIYIYRNTHTHIHTHIHTHTHTHIYIYIYIYIYRNILPTDPDKKIKLLINLKHPT